MVWYDVVVLLVLFLTGWRGAQRGLITPLAWIAAIVLPFKFSDSLAPMLTPHISIGEANDPARHWVAMFILFIGFAIASFLVAGVIDSSVQKSKLKELNRFFGGVLGLVFGLTLVLVVTFFTSVWSPTRSAVLESRTGHYACVLLDAIKPITPKHFHDYFFEYQNRLPKQNEGELGEGSSELPDFLSDDLQGAGSDGDFELPEFEDNGLAGGGASSESRATGPTLDDLMRAIPAEIQEQYGTRLQKFWSGTSARDRGRLVDQLRRAYDFEMPGILSEFLTRSDSEPGSTDGRRQFDAMLNEIGDVYQDRDQIVQRTMQYLAGIPQAVQEAVVADWHADLTLQSSDPDPSTDITTRLDDRILRQLEQARYPLSNLSYELRQRLNRSRR